MEQGVPCKLAAKLWLPLRTRLGYGLARCPDASTGPKRAHDCPALTSSMAADAFRHARTDRGPRAQALDRMSPDGGAGEPRERPRRIEPDA